MKKWFRLHFLIVQKIVLQYDIDRLIDSNIEKKEGQVMMREERIKNSGELEFAIFCMENVAAKLSVCAVLAF